MSVLVKPFSSSYDCSTTAACAKNFPCLKHFFPFEENAAVSPITAFTDVAGGVTLVPANANTTNTDGIVGWAGSGPTMTGVWTPPGTKNVLVMVLGKPGATVNPVFSMGLYPTAVDTANIFIRLSTSTTVNAKARVGIGGGVTALNVDMTNVLASDSTRKSYALSVKWGDASGLKITDFDGTTINAGGARTAVSLATMSGSSSAFTTPQTAANIMTAPSAPGNVQVWHFTTMPSDAEIQAALAWTHAQLASLTSTILDDVGNPQGKKLVYPGFSSAYYSA